LNHLDTDAEIENVKGSWRGRLVPIRLVDAHGRAYQGAALEVEEGPSLPTPVSATQGGGQRPLLVTNTLPQRSLEPSTLPMGRKVEVQGIMCINTALPPRPQEVQGLMLLSRSNPDGDGDQLEHVIMVTHHPKALRE
jgi:hypothetical protein